MSLMGGSWADMQVMECEECKKERDRRNRLIAENGLRVQREPFVSAPYIHKNNEPKYHAMLLRAAEHSKKMRKYTLWFAAVDTPENPAQVVKDPTKLNARLEDFCNFMISKPAGFQD